MMFPVGNDVPEECQPNAYRVDVEHTPTPHQPTPHPTPTLPPPTPVSHSSPVPSKCLRTIILIAAIIFFFLFFNMMNAQNGTEDNSEEETVPVHDCSEELGEKMKSEIKALIQKEIQSSAKVCSKSSRISPEQMRSIVRDEMKRQQKNQQKPDFAAASAGGMIVDASRTWTEGYSYIYFLFIPIRSTAPPPSIVLEPTREPGDCWPMVGTKGSLVIQLAARANIVGFTMEHIDPAMSLSGGTPEAPNNFTVYGLEDNIDKEKSYLFGSYFYNNEIEEDSQYFRVQNANRKSFMFILLEISSNHGNDKYTCLYRFQVHGYIDRAYHCQ